MADIEVSTVGLTPVQLSAIMVHLKRVNELWQAQETSEVYVDFPDSYPVRSTNGELLGQIKWDEGWLWIFHAATYDEHEDDDKARHTKPETPTEWRDVKLTIPMPPPFV
jgi:hypothetical protein